MNSLLVLSVLVAVASAMDGFPTAYSGFDDFNPTAYSGFYQTGYDSYGSNPTAYSAYGYNPTAYSAYGYNPTTYGYNGYAAPYSYATTYHAQDELGQASYGHVQADQSHNAVRDAYGNVRGGYSYISPEGKLIEVRYTAGVGGFQVESNALPVAPVDTNVAPVYTGVAPAPVDFTPEVKAATAEHLAAVAEANSRSRRSLGIHAPAGFYSGLPAFYAAQPARYAAHPALYAGVPARYAAHPALYAGVPAAPVVTYSASAGYPAELTEVILNPGHATAYRVDPVA